MAAMDFLRYSMFIDRTVEIIQGMAGGGGGRMPYMN
jgi:hypothetical protein